MAWYESFFIGVAGAFVVYCMLYRESRIKAFLENPQGNWNLVVFDLLIFLVCVGLVTLFFVEPKTSKEAFIGGCAWQGLAGGAMAGAELRALQRYTARKRR